MSYGGSACSKSWSALIQQPWLNDILVRKMKRWLDLDPLIPLLIKAKHVSPNSPHIRAFYFPSKLIDSFQFKILFFPTFRPYPKQLFPASLTTGSHPHLIYSQVTTHSFVRLLLSSYKNGLDSRVRQWGESDIPLAPSGKRKLWNRCIEHATGPMRVWIRINSIFLTFAIL